MSDPEKAAELQKAVSTGQSPSQGCNSDNAYWSGSSLPTQVTVSSTHLYCVKFTFSDLVSIALVYLILAQLDLLLTCSLTYQYTFN